ncbi:hypothetical protein HYALB_00007546 [Hymenoscyphus albidus]|uniref:Uncharacterized protein n=1 Tax=Hymenoscyphus albidus TaxID=595503 RepID=A0A9N9Q5L9_9HELO|nr:hypothetical protein HYALB_00007546 [Hymenoscyphus albidus]
MDCKHHTSRIFDTITSKSFFQSSDEEVLRLILDQTRTSQAGNLYPQQACHQAHNTVASQILYGLDYDEVNPTLVGILSRRWLHNRDYQTFVGSQEEIVKLSKASFEWLCELFEEGITSDTDLDYLVTSMVINDLGKDPQLAKDYEAQTGEDTTGSNHDMILHKAVGSGLVGCLDRLSNANRLDVVRSLELGAEFNFGQLAQAENVLESLSGLLGFKQNDRMFEFRFMEQILDLSGAAGHTDWTCAKKTNEPIFQAYQKVFDVANCVIYGKLGLRPAYDLILIRRAELLHGVGFRKLDVGDVHDRALMRFLCMGGVTGERGRPAVQATYFPALLSKALDSVRSTTDEDRIETLQSCLRYLRRVLQIDEPIEDDHIVVVKRDLLRVVNDVDPTVPDILDSVRVPEWEVAKLWKFI